MVKGWLGASSTDALVANITPNLNTAQLAEIVGYLGLLLPLLDLICGPLDGHHAQAEDALG
jgi:hypothetical protein